MTFTPVNMKEDPNFLGRSNREARSVANLDHPNIALVVEINHA